jgi:hypothetical protein
LKLGAGITVIGRGLMAEQGETIGVDSQRHAVEGKGAAKVLEVTPGGVSGNKDTSQEMTRVVIHCQEQGLFILCGPPLVDGGIVLPQFSQAGAFPAAAGLGDGRERIDQEREVTAGVSGDGFAIALEIETSQEFVGDELIVGWSLEREEGLQELLDLGGPEFAMVATREVEGEGGWLLKPGGAQAKEVSPTDAQELGGGVRVEVAAIESVERLVEKG